MDGTPAGQLDGRLIAVVAGVEQDHLVPGADAGHHRAENTLRRARYHGDLALGVAVHAPVKVQLGGDRLPQAEDAGHGRVLVVAGHDVPGKRLPQCGGRIEVRKALGQVQRAALGSQCRHPGEYRGAHPGQLALDPGHSWVSRGSCVTFLISVTAMWECSSRIDGLAVRVLRTNSS